ncbi:MAG: hypothetical protein FWH47_04355, partial [Methanomassiliicoccaceae archaeon]|nr:hypothetical protein [Methanomassiliicoccaceae archaeon]
MNVRWLTALAAVLIAFVLAGQVVAYWANPHQYGSEAAVSDGDIAFSVHGPSSDYSALAYDNKGFEPVTELYVFMDAGYSGGLSGE